MRAMESIPRVQHVALLTCAVTHYEQNTVRNRYPKLVKDFQQDSVDLRPYMSTRTEIDDDCTPSCSGADVRPPRLVPLIQVHGFRRAEFAGACRAGSVLLAAAMRVVSVLLDWCGSIRCRSPHSSQSSLACDKKQFSKGTC
jgi:hypothetical protein